MSLSYTKMIKEEHYQSAHMQCVVIQCKLCEKKRNAVNRCRRKILQNEIKILNQE